LEVRPVDTADDEHVGVVRRRAGGGVGPPAHDPRPSPPEGSEAKPGWRGRGARFCTDP